MNHDDHTRHTPPTPSDGEPRARDPGPPGLRDALQAALGPTVALGEELPRGGMSRVFAAYDTALQRKVAVKVLAPDLAESLSVERFRREIMVAASLQHPNIVPVLAAGEVGELPYFIMPFVEGESLRARLKRGPLSVRETVSVMRDVARALSTAHENGIVHRDIKPDNVMLAGGVAMVTDFGVAKAVAAARRSAPRDDVAAASKPRTLTGAGMAIGTPAYMAPEQAAGEVNTDHRADLYSLGILGYEMLTGTRPFHGRTMQQLMAEQLAGTPTPIARRRTDVPAELDTLIMQCLEKSADRRPRTATGVVRVLENPDLVSGPSAATPGTARRRSRRRWRLGIWTGVALLVGAGLVYDFWPATSGRGETALQATILVPTFRATDGDAQAGEWALAVAEQIVVRLSQLTGIRIAGPPRADAMVGTGRPVGDSAGAAVPTLTLDGLLQRTGWETRLTVRLVDERGFTLWGQTYGATESDPLQVQDRLTGAVVTDLVAQLRSILNIPAK